MNIPSSQQYQALLELLIEQNADEPIELIFVGDVAVWCSEHNKENQGNPSAKTIKDRNTGRAGILLRREIDPDRVNDIKDRLDANGRWMESAQLDAPEKLLTFLVLHELAHFLNDWGQGEDEQCDAWAFARMGM